MRASAERDALGSIAYFAKSEASVLGSSAMRARAQDVGDRRAASRRGGGQARGRQSDHGAQGLPGGGDPPAGFARHVERRAGEEGVGDADAEGKMDDLHDWLVLERDLLRVANEDRRRLRDGLRTSQCNSVYQ